MSEALKQTVDNCEVKQVVNAELEIQFYQAQLEFLYGVAQTANSYADVEKLIEQILSITQRILRASASSLLVVDEEKGELYFQSAQGDIADKIKQMRLDLDSGIAGWVVRNGVALIANDVSRDARFNQEVDKASGFETKSVIAMPLIRGKKVIGVLEILNKDGGFTERDLTILKGLAETEALILLVSMTATVINSIKLRQALLNDYKGTVETLITIAEGRDPYSYGHSQRVRNYTLMAASSLSFSAEELEALELGALLHDIGKIGISDMVLKRSGGLTTEDRYIIKKHPQKGADIISAIPFLENLRPIILHHHEWYDGTGYPEMLKGEEIPIGARLVAVTEAFDTMITEHSHRAAMSADAAISELVSGTGTQFCPVAVEAFISAFRKQGSV
ncbi:HD-GYP domain-containing protein [Chloroflexota bacterium]